MNKPKEAKGGTIQRITDTMRVKFFGWFAPGPQDDINNFTFKNDKNDTKK